MAEEPKQTRRDPGHKPDEELDEEPYRDLEPDPDESANITGGWGDGTTGVGNTIGGKI